MTPSYRWYDDPKFLLYQAEAGGGGSSPAVVNSLHLELVGTPAIPASSNTADLVRVPFSIGGDAQGTDLSLDPDDNTIIHFASGGLYFAQANAQFTMDTDTAGRLDLYNPQGGANNDGTSFNMGHTLGPAGSIVCSGMFYAPPNWTAVVMAMGAEFGAGTLEWVGIDFYKVI